MFERNIDNYSIEEQMKLHLSTVAICGLGGGGGTVTEILARTGVGNFILIDGDKFEESNKNRQIGCLTNTIGKYKAEILADRIRNINKYVNVKYYNEYLSDSNYNELLSNADIICDTVDGNNKFLVDVCSRKLKKPHVTGGLGGFSFWTATLVNRSIYDIMSETEDKSKAANPSSVFIQGGLQAQMIIDFLLNRNTQLHDKIISMNNLTYSMIVEDIISKDVVKQE